MSKTDVSEVDRLRAALHSAHDHLHAGRVEEAHQSLHCGINDEVPETGNITLDATIRLSHLIEGFNHLCKESGLKACMVAFVDSATKPGCVSLQVGGEISACRMLERMLNAPPSNYAVPK